LWQHLNSTAGFDIAPVPGKPPLPITRFDPDHSWEPVD
jgi:hypothetical protein